jgi:cell filamentation protein, protein adenylyltransferase
VAGSENHSRAAAYDRLDRSLAELNQRLGGLPGPGEARAAWAELWHAEVHHSTALGGNALLPREVAALLDSGRALGGRLLSDYNEVRGYANAARWVYGQQRAPGAPPNGGLITLSEIRHLHYIALTPAWDVAPHPEATGREGPGEFRQRGLPPLATGEPPPAWPQVPAALRQWVQDACALGGPGRGAAGERLWPGGPPPPEGPPPPGARPRPGGHPRPEDRLWPEDLARLHSQFERVHPFLAGNGRAGRLALNLVLLRLGWPPLVILKRQRAAYLTALQRADAGDYGPLGALIAQSLADTISRFLPARSSATSSRPAGAPPSPRPRRPGQAQTRGRP